jgi:lipoprotein-anchoring transpeptidase ErfK/SrfK
MGGRSGNETKRLQQRLLDLGFWLSKVSGRYELTTRQAVMAFQKYNKLKPTGYVDSTTATLLTQATERVQAKSTSGNIIEVDKDLQVIFFVKDGVTQFALNTSTGSGQYFLEKDQNTNGQWAAGRAITYSGHFKINRQRPEGWWEGDLGKIYRPKYFNGGEAIHGLSVVPGHPASHGCVRVSVPAMDYLWTLDWVTLHLKVWVYGNDVDARNKPIPIPPSTTSTSTTTPRSTTSTSTTSSTTTTTLALVN